MEKIIPQVSIELIKSELTSERFLRRTSKADNELYIINAFNAPNTMREIARLREEAFRDAGGGTGKELDIDEFDTMPEPCQQLIVWSPDTNEIIGGYRFILGENVKYGDDGQPLLATSHLFHFSQKFIDEYMLYTLELGRSFVNVKFQHQSESGVKSLYALDNLWDGLGALTVMYPQIKYFFGKVTMYPSFGYKGRDMILYFMNKHYKDNDNLVVPHKKLKLKTSIQMLKEIFINASSIKESYKILNGEVRSLGQNIPPLVNAYMNLSPSMIVFGTAINDEFGDVEETGILITVNDIYKEKRERYIEHSAAEMKKNFDLNRFGIS